MSEVKTCALCRHCDIDIGSVGWSELTPGSSGSMDCRMRFAGFPGDDNEGTVDLVHLARVAAVCPHFQLLEIPK